MPTARPHFLLMGLKSIQPYASYRVLRKLGRCQIVPKDEDLRTQVIEISSDGQFPEARVRQIWSQCQYLEANTCVLNQARGEVSPGYQAWYKGEMSSGRPAKRPHLQEFAKASQEHWDRLAKEREYLAEIGKLKQQIKDLKFKNKVQVAADKGKKNRLTRESENLKAQIRRMKMDANNQLRSRADTRLIAELRSQVSKSREDLEGSEAFIARMRIRWARVTAAGREHLWQELTIKELVGNLKTYEIKKKIDSERKEPKKEKSLVLKADNNDSSEEDSDMAYLTYRFQKMVRRNGEILKKGSSSKPKNCDLYHKCGKPGHFIKDCPLLKQEFSKNNPEKAAKRNSALAAWGYSSGESEDETDAGDSSTMAVEVKENEYDSTLALMAQSYDDEDNDNKEVNVRDVQRNLKSYSSKKLMSLASVLIDAYHSLVEDRDSLTLELGEVQQTRDDLVVVVIDHKETIENFKEETNDLLVVIANLRETIERLETNSKLGNSEKGKEIASEEHIRLENKLKAVKTRMCVETEKQAPPN
ncbi:uncharacterized protein [Nicotiana sylvestris]|uniref:uncharacterized protein n=1 Tax=Nicotiana sylvestris TaxID=4096 RepID=UPI00388C955B